MKLEKVIFIYSSAVSQADLHLQGDNRGEGDVGVRNKRGQKWGWVEATTGLKGPEHTASSSGLSFSPSKHSPPRAVFPLPLSSILLLLRPPFLPRSLHSNTSSPPASALHQEQNCDT